MINHSSRDHALLSASASNRWINCTPSARLEETFEDTQSEAAKEGTIAHELAEIKTLNYFYTKKHNKRTLNKKIEELKENPLWQDEMIRYVDDYIDFIKKIAMEFKHEPYIAIEQRLDYSKYANEGFGTADLIMIGDNKLVVIDFKYGKGVPVSSENNSQMLIYALGAYEKYKMLYGFKEIKLCIAQPRLDNYSVFETSLDNLLEFGESLKTISETAFKGEGEYKAGEWCRFCRAKSKCRTRAEENTKLAFFTDKKPPLLSNDEVGDYLKQGEDVARWLSDLKDYALGECLNGNEIKGYKAVEGRGSRVWTSEDDAFNKLCDNGIDKEVLFEKVPLSLAKVEKLIGKKEFVEIVGEFVDKKAGKPTLVEESDKRPAITNKVTAKDVFNS